MASVYKTEQVNLDADSDDFGRITPRMRPPSRHQLPGREVTAKVVLAQGDVMTVAPEVSIRLRVDGTVRTALTALDMLLHGMGFSERASVDADMEVRIGKRSQGDIRYR